MALASEVRKLTDTKAFYAVAGCGDLAVEKLREVPARLQEVQGRLQDFAADRAELQQRAMTYANSVTTTAASTYDDLAKRGRDVVGRVQGQESTEQLEDRAKTTSQQTKAAVTSARKTASSAKKAATEGADQVG